MFRKGLGLCWFRRCQEQSRWRRRLGCGGGGGAVFDSGVDRDIVKDDMPIVFAKACLQRGVGEGWFVFIGRLGNRLQSC